jgi:hypothetical protein
MIAPPRRPSRDELEALMKEARERQLRRRLLGAAGVAIVAAVALGVFSVLGGFGQNGSTGGSRRGSAPLCRSSQLSAVPLGFGMASGDVGGLDIKNVGSLSCVLPGTPRVVVYARARRLPVRQLPPNAAVPDHRDPVVHVLAPGERAAVIFLWSNWCRPPSSSAQATLRYHFGGGLVLSERWGEPACAAPGSPSTLRIAGPLAG